MARKVSETILCDRCTRHIRTVTRSPSEEAPKVETTTGLRLLRLLPPTPGEPGREETVVEFRDLCESCDAAVQNILKRLTLEESPEESPKRRRARESTGPAAESAASEPAPPQEHAPSAATATSGPTDPHRPF
jgi:hypothetical protein